MEFLSQTIVPFCRKRKGDEKGNKTEQNRMRKERKGKEKINRKKVKKKKSKSDTLLTCSCL